MTVQTLLEALSHLAAEEKKLPLWIDEDLNESGNPEWEVETDVEEAFPLFAVEIIRWKANGRCFVSVTTGRYLCDDQELVRTVWTAPKPEPTLAERVEMLTPERQKTLNTLLSEELWQVNVLDTYTNLLKKRDDDSQ